MVTTLDPNRPVAALLLELERAVAVGDAALATELEAAILKRLFAESVARDDAERRTRELMERLELAQAALAPPPPLAPKSGFSFSAELSGARVGKVYPVWFATNRRAADDTSQARWFSGERGDAVVRGRVDVFVPKGHRVGELGTKLLTKLRRLDLSDDTLTVHAVEPQHGDAFFAALAESLQAAQAGGQRSEALVFIHGFKTTFEEAALRAAQLGVDLGLPPGTAGFFSWPSKGNVRSYPADEASIEASERAIADFLIDFCSHSGASKVHLIAHSMGNRGLLRALQRIAADTEAASRVRFGQIFLAAPDLDRDLFLDLAHLYPTCSERTTLYASSRDLPVHASADVHQAPRAGYFAPYTVAPAIDTVCVPNFNLDLLGHSYFSQADALLYDIGGLMRFNEPPPRQRLEAFSEGGRDFWRIKR